MEGDEEEVKNPEESTDNRPVMAVSVTPITESQIEAAASEAVEEKVTEIMTLTEIRDRMAALEAQLIENTRAIGVVIELLTELSTRQISEEEALAIAKESNTGEPATEPEHREEERRETRADHRSIAQHFL